MKLYYSPGACALASQIVLREAGMKFDLVKVDLKAKTIDGSEDYKAINPKGYVPAITLPNGELMTEGNVILQWISDQVPEKKLLPKFGTMERYRAMEWLNYIATELHKGYSGLFNPAFNEDAKAAVTSRIHLRLGVLDAHLAGKKYILGDEFSACDAYAYNIIRWSRGLKVDLSQHKNVLAFMERMSERPAVRAAVEAEGLRI